MRNYGAILLAAFLMLIGPALAADDGQPAPEGRTVTLDDNGKTLSLKVNETFLLKLGEFYDWNITIDDTAVVSRDVNVLVVRGAQGIYRAHKSGSATLIADGDPTCRKSVPPCAAPSIRFRLDIAVSGDAIPKAPAFEIIPAIIALLAAVRVRRK
ncbi:MAG TPA: hypothetical protein HA257_05690 [Candidatus Methanoperedenaceae archaeon]|nr:hypothetical protein [Candidatus Methanoperedenaceae archaeon]